MTALLFRADRVRDGNTHRILWVVALIAGAALVALCIGGAAFGQAVPVPDPDPDEAPIHLPQTTEAPPVPPNAAPIIGPTGAPTAAPTPTAPVVDSGNDPKDENPPVGVVTPSGRYSLVLNDGTRIYGMPGDRKTVPFECVLGHVEVPMVSIHTIEFVVDVHGAKSHRVRFHNGDTMTGIVGPWEHVKFHTQYGELTVPLASMVRMSSTGAASNATAIAASASKPADVSQVHPTPVERAQLRIAPAPYAEAAPGPVRPLRGPVVDDDDVE